MKFYWKIPNSDNFTSTSEWTPSVVPGASDQALLTGTGTAYDVNVMNGDSETVLTISTSADAILNIIQNSSFTAEDGTGSGTNNGSIHVEGGSFFDVAGTINNRGTIELLGTGVGASFVLLGDTTLNGGTLTLSDTNSANRIIGGGMLTNAGNSEILGAGEIDVAVNNKATVLPSGKIIPVIDATGSNFALLLNGTVTNTGELLGDGSAGLILDSTVYNIGGLIEAGTGLVQLGNLGTIIGGTIENAGGTFLVVDGTLDGGGTHPITVFGQISVDDGQSLNLQGAFKIRDAVITLQTSAALLLGLANTVAVDSTFSGGGQIFLTSAAIDLNPSTHVGSVPPKLNNVDNIINGTGAIGNAAATPGSFVLNNEAKGIVQALNGELTIYSNVTNAGLLDAANGDLRLVGNVVTNTGSLKAEVGATISLQSTTIHGGTLTGGGTFHADDAVLDGSTSVLTNTSTIDMGALHGEVRTLTLKGTINNTGTMELFPTESSGIAPSPGPLPIGSDLVIGATGKSNTVTLKGGGSIGLDAYGDDYIIGDADSPGGVPTTLNNVDNVIIGVGRIGDGGLTLKNSGSIDADTEGTSASPLVIDTGGRTVTNTGSFEALDDSTLFIDSPINNTGGKLSAIHSGELIADQGAIGGTATMSEGGTIEFGGPTTTAVQFADNPFEASALVLDDSVHFKGVISGFAKVDVNETIDLLDIDSATAQKVSYTAGVLTIKDSEGHTTKLHFSGTYTLASFNLDPDGHGGTLLTDPPIQSKPQKPSNNPASLFSQFMASWTNSIAALASEIHSPLASELQTLISVPHAHG